jgi:hypothetical protein
MRLICRKCFGAGISPTRELHSAVIAAIAEIHKETKHQPDDQPGPVHPPELVNHVTVECDPKQQDCRYARRTEGTGLRGIGVSQYDYTRADDHEGEQCANVYQLVQILYCS